MIGSFRNFAKTKFAGLLVFIMIIPFVFWGMGSMFSSGNTNNLAKINNKNISTKEFLEFLNKSGIPEKSIRDNLDNEIVEELLSNLISTTLLDLEIENFKIFITENTLLKKIKENKNFIDEEGMFQRTKYEKFLLQNNVSAPEFEQRLKEREVQKNLFDYIGGGTVSPKFLIKKLFENENKKLNLDFINLENFYKNKKDITEEELKSFVNENKDQLKVEYIDFKYSKINPKNLIGVDEFNQSFFDKIDEIEIDISNDVEFDRIVNNLNIEYVTVSNFRFSENKNKIEKKIFEMRNNNFDIIEFEDEYLLYHINNFDDREPNLKDNEIKNEILDLVFKKNQFEYNKNLLEKIQNKKFSYSEFKKMSKNNINSIKLNSNRDNKKFEINSITLLYSLPENSFTLISDEKNTIYLAHVKNYQNEKINFESNDYKQYINKQNSNSKNEILKSYDLLLNTKYNVTLNEKTIDRVKNFFK